MKRLVQLLLFLSVLTGQAQGMEKSMADSRLSEPAQLLQKYLQIPSESGQEARAESFLMEICRSRGLFTREMGRENANFNFTASLFPLEDNKPNIILLNHIDVVPESDVNVFGPYSGVIENGNLYGRGAIDNKGAGIMQLSALLKIKANENYRESEYNVSLLPKMEIEVVVPDAIADEAIKAIISAARTGEIGDGRVFVLPVLDSYRIRTGERES